MNKQKKITEKAEEEEVYQTPLQALLSYLYLPHKIYRSIYLYVIERRLSSNPLIQSEESIALIARQVGVEPALMAEKIKNMTRMKWLCLEEAGRRDTNQIFVLSPIWRFTPGMNETKFAVALREYKAGITTDIEYQRSTEEIYALMNSVCKHTKEAVDESLCESDRWEECRTCVHGKNRQERVKK